MSKVDSLPFHEVKVDLIYWGRDSGATVFIIKQSRFFHCSGIYRHLTEQEPLKV